MLLRHIHLGASHGKTCLVKDKPPLQAVSGLAVKYVPSWNFKNTEQPLLQFWVVNIFSQQIH